MQTALISALTAAVVTLLIEYLAKPRLEARKDRIVEGARQRRTLGIELVGTVAIATRLQKEAVSEFPREHWEKPVDDLEARLSRAETAFLGAALTYRPLQVEGILGPLIAARTTCRTLRSVLTYGMSDGSEAKLVAPALELIARNARKASSCAEIRGWQIWKYWKLRKQEYDHYETGTQKRISSSELPDDHPA